MRCELGDGNESGGKAEKGELGLKVDRLEFFDGRRSRIGKSNPRPADDGHLPPGSNSVETEIYAVLSMIGRFHFPVMWNCVLSNQKNSFASMDWLFVTQD